MLVDRVWPRGLRKDALRLDDWAKDVAPSTELRTWYGHDPVKFGEFRQRYLGELAVSPRRAALGKLRTLAGSGRPLTLLVHDLGRAAVPAGLWERPGQLRPEEWELVRLHPYHTGRILARSPVLAPPAAARILSGRPLDRDVIRAVLEAAGAPPASLPPLPADLTERELDVLRRMLIGRTKREIATDLVLSPSTVHTHTVHIYAKCGVSTRAALAMFAMRHGLAASTS